MMDSPEQDLDFELTPAQREQVFFKILFVTYPAAVFRWVRSRPQWGEFLFWSIFSLFAVPRNLATALLSHFPFRVIVDYRVRLYQRHLSFGAVVSGTERLLANHYGAIIGTGRTRDCRFAVLRDGWIVYLPSTDEGKRIQRLMEERRNSFRLSEDELRVGTVT